MCIIFQKKVLYFAVFLRKIGVRPLLIGIWPHKVITLDLMIIFRSHLFQCCDYREKKIGHKDRAFSLSDFYLMTTITSSSRIKIGIVCCWQKEQLCTLGIIVLGHDAKLCNYSSSIGLKNFVSCLISGYSSSDKRILNFLTLFVTFQLPFQRNVGTRMPTLTFGKSYQELYRNRLCESLQWITSSQSPIL